MSEDTHPPASSPHAGKPANEPDYWLDQPQNINLLVKVLIAACVIVVGADFFYHKHGHFGFQEWFAFDAVFGFAAYVGLVNSAKLLRKIVMRDEDYYTRAETRTGSGASSETNGGGQHD